MMHKSNYDRLLFSFKLDICVGDNIANRSGEAYNLLKNLRDKQGGTPYEIPFLTISGRTNQSGDFKL